MEDKTLLAIYENAWNVFYGQHAQTGRNALRSLQPLHSWGGQHDGSAMPFGSIEPSDASAENFEPEQLDEDLVHRKELEPADRARLSLFVDRNSQRRPSVSKTTVERPRLRCSTIKPGPQYESVDVIAQNIYLGENEKVFHPRVIPYGDNPSFSRDHGANFIVQHGPLLDQDENYVEWAQKCRETRPFASTRPEESAIEVLAVMHAVDYLLSDSGSRLEAEHKQLLERLKGLEKENEACRLFSDGIIPSTNGEGILSHITSGLVWYWPPLAMYRKSKRAAVVTDIFRDYAKRRTSSLFEMTQTLIKSGCSRPDCLHTFCESHPPIAAPKLDTNEPFIGALRSLPRKARRPANVLSTAAIDEARAKTTPCGPECFLHHESETDGSDIIWEQSAEEELAIQVTVCPDLGPCDLAYIVVKPCWEVYAKRKDLEAMARHHPEVDSFFNFRPKTPEQPVRELLEVQLKPDRFSARARARAKPRGPHEPCDHDGPCTTGVCSCYRMDGHCTSGCGCEDGCGRKFTGCTCCGSGKRGGCGPNSKCPCRMRARDCEIGLCTNPQRKKPSQQCLNMAVTNDPSAELIVYNGAFGYGVFAKKRIAPKAFLGLYIGEVLKRRRSEIQEVVAEHTHRNYLFTLHKGEKNAPDREDIPMWSNELVNSAPMDCDTRGWHHHATIDSGDAGNSTRFANHGDFKNINAIVEHRWVQGDVVLAFYATKTIEKRDEIIINYGADYFKNLPDSHEGHAAAVDGDKDSDTDSD